MDAFDRTFTDPTLNLPLACTFPRSLLARCVFSSSSTALSRSWLFYVG